MRTDQEIQAEADRLAVIGTEMYLLLALRHAKLCRQQKRDAIAMLILAGTNLLVVLFLVLR